MERASSPEPEIGPSVISVSFDLRAIIRVALVWAAEYAMLSLIEDAPTAIKVATLICAVSALAVMQFEVWVRSISKHSFRNAICGLTVIYLGFLGYAVAHAVNRLVIRHGLETYYIAAGELANRPIPLNEDKNHMDIDAIKRLAVDVDNWQAVTALWLEKRLGPIGRERFLDISNMPSLTWSQADQTDPAYSSAINRLTRDRHNLSVIIETGAYGP
jgi:hypothetical protein